MSQTTITDLGGGQDVDECKVESEQVKTKVATSLFK